MIGTITHILAKAGYKAMNGPLADERRRLAGAETPAAYVSYEPRLLAGVGLYGYRIALKGGDRQMLERARYMLAERYTIRDGYEYYADGVYTFGVLLHQRVKLYGIGGGAEPGPPTIDPTWLYFTMPEGGTVTLTKNGSPTEVVLEYSLDNGSTWTEWVEESNVRSLALNAGQTMHVRNTSPTSTGFSTSGTSFYQFSFDTNTYSGGNIMSLKCIDPSLATMTNHCWRKLFMDCVKLITAADMSSVTSIGTSGCGSMYYGCTSLTTAADMSSVTSIGTNGCNNMYSGCTSLTTAADMSSVTSIGSSGCSNMYYGCNHLALVRIGNPDISASNCLKTWLYGVAATGDFYCSPLLTIPTGASGIPVGWTRHDI